VIPTVPPKNKHWKRSTFLPKPTSTNAEKSLVSHQPGSITAMAEAKALRDAAWSKWNEYRALHGLSGLDFLI
jgi:hypothetical protein